MIVLAGCVRGLVTAGGEAKLGAEQAAKVEQSLGVVSDPTLSSYVSAVGARLASASPRVRGGFAYHFQVVDLAPPNAFALPGGYVYVSRGLVALLDSEDELANVLAHELAHVSNRHHLRHAVRSTPFLPVNLAAGISGFAAGIVSPTLGRAISAIGKAPGGLVLASYSRGQENEADATGQQFAAAAGWNPAAMADVMQTLTRDERQRGGDPERRDYFSTHPTNPDRARKTAANALGLEIADARSIAADRGAFLANLDGLLVGSSAREGAIAGREFLHPELDFRIAFPKGWKIVDDGLVVRAFAKNEDAVAMLSIVGEDEAPESIAKKVLAGKSLSVEQGPESLRVGDLDAVRAVAGLKRSGEEYRYVLTWLAHGGRVYQISAGAYLHAWQERREALDAVGRSFRPLQEDDWPRIREGRLRIATAEAGDTLGELMPPESAWTLAEMALANDLAPDAVLGASALVKVAPLEPYVPEPDAGRD